MKDQASNATTMQTATVSTAIPKSLQLVSAFLLGMVFLYGAGFVQTSAVHNAAHDARSLAGVSLSLG